MKPPRSVNLHSLAYPITSLGPGRRLALWVSGCQRRCQGCISPERQDHCSGRSLDSHRLAGWVLKRGNGLDGVTISGGEPFDQAEALAELVENLQRARPGWSVLVYSGYTLEELRTREGDFQKLLRRVDVLLDGPYRAEIPPRHPLLGSGNQRLHYLTPRGLALKEEIAGTPWGRFDLGVGPHHLKMLIGVNQKVERAAVLSDLHGSGNFDEKS